MEKLTRESKMMLAERIIDVFDGLIKEYGIQIPNDEIEERLLEDSTVSRDEIGEIYGNDYFYCEDEVLNILYNEGLLSREDA